MCEVRQTILDKIAESEENYDVKVIFAVESGSRGWGFESPDSDYDCRFVYVRKKETYLSLFDQKDFIEYDADEIFDINGWDLTKCLKHLVKSNATLLEWLSSKVVYVKNQPCTDWLAELGEQYFNPLSVSHHYLSLAKKKYMTLLESGNEAKIKGYFYILRALANLKYIDNYNKMPPMNYFETMGEIDLADDIVNEIKKLYDLKIKVNESYSVRKNDILLKYFSEEIDFYENELKSRKVTVDKNYQEVDELFRKILDRIW